MAMCQFYFVLSLGLLSHFPSLDGATAEPKFEAPHRGCYLVAQTIHDLSTVDAFKLSDVKPTLCTYVVYGYASFQDNELQITGQDEGNLRLLNFMRKANPGIILLLALNGGDKTVADNLKHSFVHGQNRSDFVSTVVEKLRIWSLDGIMFHVDSMDFAASNTMSILIKDLHVRFSEEAAVAPRLALGLHVGHSAKSSMIDPALIGTLADIVEVHGYDYHSPDTEPSYTGHNAPLQRTSVQGSHAGTIENTMVGWDAAGIPKEKLVLVLSLYGQSWQLIGRLHRFEAGAPASGATPPFGYANTEGRMFYHDICEQISGGNLTRVFDTDGMAPYAHNNETLWVSYDDVDSCKIKARWVLEKGYGGVAFYELSMEDYDGSCGHDSFLTLHGVAEVFATASRVNINDKRDCDRVFCIKRGPGVFAMGSCTEVYCSCDHGGKSYKVPCGPGTVFDPLILACNYATAIKGCEQLETKPSNSAPTTPKT